MNEIAFLALGANLGDRRGAMAAAVDSIASIEQVRLTGVSGLYACAAAETTIAQPNFLNAVVRVSSGLPAERLLDAVLEIENALGRERPAHHAPRTIDIDILSFGDMIVDTPNLQLPHPRMHNRMFVLKPLADIDPEWVHPRSGLVVGQLLRKIEPDPSLRVVEADWYPVSESVRACSMKL